MIREYLSTENDMLVLILDDDGDKLNSIDIAFRYIKKVIKPSECNYQLPFLYSGEGYFIKDSIYLKIICSSWFGTEMMVDKTISEENLSKVRQWAKEIYQEIHKE